MAHLRRGARHRVMLRPPSPMGQLLLACLLLLLGSCPGLTRHRDAGNICSKSIPTPPWSWAPLTLAHATTNGATAATAAAAVTPPQRLDPFASAVFALRGGDARGALVELEAGLGLAGLDGPGLLLASRLETMHGRLERAADAARAASARDPGPRTSALVQSVTGLRAAWLRMASLCEGGRNWDPASWCALMGCICI